MGRRKRAEETLWLAGWKDTPASENTALVPLDEPNSAHDNLSTLTQLGYMVRISGAMSSYRVVCVALFETAYGPKEQVGLSYCGADLRSMLAAASYEADLISCSPSSAEYQVEEKPRWVPS